MAKYLKISEQASYALITYIRSKGKIRVKERGKCEYCDRIHNFYEVSVGTREKKKSIKKRKIFKKEKIKFLKEQIERLEMERDIYKKLFLEYVRR